MFKPLFTLAIASALLAGSLLNGTTMANDNAVPPMLLEHASPLGFEDTVNRLEKNAIALGWKVPGKWKVDFQKNLKKVTGKDIGKNKVLKMCAPEAAVPLLMQDKYKMLTALMPFAGTTLSSDRLGKHGVIHERGNIPTRAQIYAHPLKCKLIPQKYVIRRASCLALRPRDLSSPLCVDDVSMHDEG